MIFHLLKMFLSEFGCVVKQLSIERQKPKPKWSLWPIAKDYDNLVIQSNLEANTCCLHEARENMYQRITIGLFGVTSDWLRKWREFFKPIISVVIQNQSTAKQTTFTFDTQVYRQKLNYFCFVLPPVGSGGMKASVGPSTFPSLSFSLFFNTKTSTTATIIAITTRTTTAMIIFSLLELQTRKQYVRCSIISKTYVDNTRLPYHK